MVGGNCRKWSGGSLDVTTTSQNFIWSIGNNEQVATTKPDAEIHQHKAFGFYALNLKDATSTNANSNPFLTSGASTNGTSSSTSSGSGASSTGNVVSVASPRTKADKVLIAHGMILSFAASAFYCFYL